ncbi:cytochrome P450 [Streptomyces sp. TLI_55]|uniref:cytochrome P450 n=1 Tax=Streptomyces sp. TLI_55 TaxID=1938861 RepID=UPI00211CD5BD|nr:cytochrome P450 [Streptomyces sp. TLI_55]
MPWTCVATRHAPAAPAPGRTATVPRPAWQGPSRTAGPLPDAIEEFLHYDSSVERTTNRYVAKDLELGGVHISRGDVVGVTLGSASRDAPPAGGGDPDALNITRPTVRHLAFGHGIHHCLGAPLARLEARVALHALLTRLPHLELAVLAESLDWFPAGMVRGVLPVRYRTQS